MSRVAWLPRRSQARQGEFKSLVACPATSGTQALFLKKSKQKEQEKESRRSRRGSQSYLSVAASQECQSMVKTIVDHFKLRELQSVVPSCVVESSGRHLIRGSNFFFFDTSGSRSEKTRFGKWKRQKTFYLPP